MSGISVLSTDQSYAYHMRVNSLGVTTYYRIREVVQVCEQVHEKPEWVIQPHSDVALTTSQPALVSGRLCDAVSSEWRERYPNLYWCNTSDLNLLPQVSSEWVKKETDSAFVIYYLVACNFQKCNLHFFLISCYLDLSIKRTFCVVSSSVIAICRNWKAAFPSNLQAN